MVSRWRPLDSIKGRSHYKTLIGAVTNVIVIERCGEMATKKQEELIHSFLSGLSEENRSIYEELILQLSELGYRPYIQRSYIVFKHKLHNKQMAKMGYKRKGNAPYFQLRFSACRGYSQRFEEIVGAHVVKKSFREAQCIYHRCDYCMGEAFSHVYSYVLPSGEEKYQCGAAALEIPDITVDDIEEIKKLIREEHVYLMKYEAGIEI